MDNARRPGVAEVDIALLSSCQHVVSWPLLAAGRLGEVFQPCSQEEVLLALGNDGPGDFERRTQGRGPLVARKK